MLDPRLVLELEEGLLNNSGWSLDSVATRCVRGSEKQGRCIFHICHVYGYVSHNGLCSVLPSLSIEERGLFQVLRHTYSNRSVASSSVTEGDVYAFCRMYPNKISGIRSIRAALGSRKR